MILSLAPPATQQHNILGQRNAESTLMSVI